MSQLSEKSLKGDIVTVSSETMVALSMAVSKRNGSTIVVMPKNTSKIKVNNVIRNGVNCYVIQLINLREGLTKLKTMGMLR